MKNFKKYIGLSLATALLWSCTYEAPEQVEPTSGSADFSKIVAVGNSLTAGYMNAALYNEGQQTSYAVIFAQQAQAVGGGAFNVPDINSVNGYNSVYSDPLNGVIRGRLVLADFTPTDDKGPSPVPANTPGLPSPYNSADLPGAYTGDKSALNNFGVPGITLGLALTPALGTPGNPLENGLYTRFASSPGTSTVISDAAAAMANGGTFLLFWLGNNDVLGYATGGASNPAILTDQGTFEFTLSSALDALLAASTDAKGAVANIPNITDIPYFTTVAYNAIEFDPSDPVDVGTVDLLNNSFAGFNAALDAIVANLGHSAEDAALRKVTYSVSEANPILINDDDLEDLGPKFDMLEGAGAITAEQRAALAPYEQARPLMEDELVTLSAGAVLGTLADPNNPTTVWGVAVPMTDQYILTSNEIDEIEGVVNGFNQAIDEYVSQNSSRLVLVDINSIFEDFAENGTTINGSGLNATISPPFGAFSLDGVHPNSRGSAFVANKFIEAVNGKFNADIPLTNPNNYSGNPLPLIIQ